MQRSRKRVEDKRAQAQALLRLENSLLVAAAVAEAAEQR